MAAMMMVGVRYEGRATPPIGDRYSLMFAMMAFSVSAVKCAHLLYGTRP